MFCYFLKVEAVELIAEGKAPKVMQSEEGATYDKIWKKKEVAKVFLPVVTKVVYKSSCRKVGADH